MSLSVFFQHCLTGISLGGAYALIAIGYPDIDPEAPRRKSVEDLLTYR